MSAKYKILNINGGEDSRFGEIVYVEANPIEQNSYSEFFISHYYEKTQYFFYPNNESLIDELVSIAQSGLWQPNMNDFKIEMMNFKGSRRQIFRHISFFEDVSKFMKYYVDEVTFNNRDFTNLGYASEVWYFGTQNIITPHGNIQILDIMFVDQGEMLGVQFSTVGTLQFYEIKGCPTNIKSTCINTVAVMRKPHNAWLWLYMFDNGGNPIASFCGHDDLDGFARYDELLKQKYN